VDSAFFVLTVDLWDADATREVNLVHHSGGAPTVSISNSTTTSYPPPPERPPMPMYAALGPPVFDQYGRPMPQPQYAAAPNYYATPGLQPSYPYAHSHAYNQPPMPMALAVAPPQTSANGMFTRNLIGSLTVNAFKLTDTEGKVGFWFILQDLSVRTEGSFRYVLAPHGFVTIH
jgi:hypothetical protein